MACKREDLGLPEQAHLGVAPGAVRRHSDGCAPCVSCPCQRRSRLRLYCFQDLSCACHTGFEKPLLLFHLLALVPALFLLGCMFFLLLTHKAVFPKALHSEDGQEGSSLWERKGGGSLNFKGVKLGRFSSSRAFLQF